MLTLRVCSFSCQSLKSSSSELRTICDSYDIVFLQETWLAKFELHMLNNVHEHFSGLGTSSFDSGNGLLYGRPFGGVAILWRKVLQPSVSGSRRLLYALACSNKRGSCVPNQCLPPYKL